MIPEKFETKYSSPAMQTMDLPHYIDDNQAFALRIIRRALIFLIKFKPYAINKTYS